MKPSNDEEITCSSSLYSISLSASLPSLTSSTSGLSESSSSSFHYPEGSGGFLSLSTTLSSVHDLQAVQDLEANAQWPRHEDDAYTLPLARGAPRTLPVLARLKRAFALHRTHLLRISEHISTWDIIVAAVFCFYLWMLLCALAGHRRGLNNSDLALCPVGLSTSLSSDPGIAWESPSPRPPI